MNKISVFIDSLSKHSTLVLRVGIGIVFVWFGWSALTNTEMWVRLVPAWTGSIASAAVMVKIHGAVELVFGLLLVLGIWRRLAAFILLVSIVHTIFLVSGPTRVRDIGLAFAALALVLAPANRLTPSIS